MRVPDDDPQKIAEPDPSQLVVSLDPSGVIKINSEAIEDSAYVDRMRRVLAAKAPEDRLVFFLPEEKANYGRVVFALDGARTAGARILGVITEPVVGIVAAPLGESATPTPPPAPAPEPPKLS